MGTNYYICCKHCGTELQHIGKQSAGWNFLSNYVKENAINLIKKAIDDPNKVFKNEYGEEISLIEFLEKVTDKWELRSLD